MTKKTTKTATKNTVANRLAEIEKVEMTPEAAELARNTEREAMKAAHGAIAPKGKATKKKAAKPDKATKTATKKAEGKKAATPAADGALAIHINKTGRVCFGKAAAERIGRMAFMTITADGALVRMKAHEKTAEGAIYIKRASGRPYVSATKILKATGKFDGTRALDLVAAPFNSHGFDIQVA